MSAVTVADAPAAMAPTAAVPTLVEPSWNWTSVAPEASVPALRTVAVSFTASDSTGLAGAEVIPVTWRSGFGAGVPRTWNSATCPAGAPELAVNTSWTSATRLVTGIRTVLALAGSKA